MISKCVEELVEKKLIIQENEKVRVTDLGLEALEPYRVKKAVILAAGFGSRCQQRQRDLSQWLK